MNKKLFLLPLLVLGLAACGSKGSGSEGGGAGGALPTGVFEGAMPAGWEYITNNPTFPEPSFYAAPAGLKLNFEGLGVTSPSFAATKDVVVNIKIGALNANTKTTTQTDVFTVYAYAGDTQVGTAAIQTAAVGDNNVTVTGTGITKIKVIMTGYLSVSGTCQNINLTSVSVAKK